MGLAAGTWEPWICPEICITWETPGEKKGFLSRGDVLAVPPAAAGAVHGVWGHSSAGTEPPSTSWLGEPNPQRLCNNKWEGEPPQEWETLGLWGCWLGGGYAGGCSRWRGGQGTRVPVSQLCPNYQLPHSSCCSVRAPSPKLPWGLLSPVSSRCPSAPSPARPQLPRGMTLCPLAWAPQRWFPLPEQTKRHWKGWARHGKGRDRHRAMAGTWLRTRELWHGQGWEQCPWGWGQRLGQG